MTCASSSSAKPNPQTPRAVFFNDEVYVGWIPGAPVIEFSEVDAKLGGVFYTIEQTATDKPRFVRNNQCLECHASAKTMGVLRIESWSGNTP